MSELMYKNFVKETLDEKGNLKDIIFDYPESFNFAYDVVDSLAKSKPNKKAMVWLSKDKEEKIFTFEDMSKYSNKAANYFASLGIGKGDKVMLILKRHYQFWFCMMALHKLGAVAVPATNQLMKKDLVYRFNKAHVKAVVCTPDDYVAMEVDKSVESCPELKHRLIVNGNRDGWKNFDEGMEKASSHLDRRPTKVTEPMLMYFSSGTTGYPKCVQHNHTYAIGHIVTAAWWHLVKEDGLHLTISDTGWGKAVWGKLYGAWLAETCVFTYDFDRFHPDDILPLFKKYNIKTFCAPPTMYRFFIKEDLSKYDLSSLEYCTIAGEALNPEVYKQWYNATGLKIKEGFGQTETTLAVANLKGMEPKPGSMGKPNPQYKVCVLDANDKPCAAGEVGEICIDISNGKPAGLFMGYFEDEEQTAAVMHDGYYHTGDMAWLDEDGYYWYVGRTDDLIKSSGYRIGPFEIESVLMEHPSVLECAVTGAPDPIRGQVVKATIVLAKGYTPSEELKKEIQNFVKKLTAPYKYPRIIDFANDLPKTISGKIKRKDIRK